MKGLILITDEQLRSQLVRFNRIHKSITDAYRHAAHRLGLPECAMWILYTIRLSDGPMTQKKLCEAMSEPKQTVNSALKKLEQDGCVTLNADPTNHRSKIIRLTGRGQALTEQTADLIIRSEITVLRRMNDEAIESLLSLQETFLSLIREETEQLAPGASAEHTEP